MTTQGKRAEFAQILRLGDEALLYVATAGDARPLTRGAPSALTLGCRAQMYVGPFRLARSGESVRIASTARSLLRR